MTFSNNPENPACTGDLTQANIIIAAGRGLRDEEHFLRLAAFAQRIGAQVGGTRGALHAGWISHKRVIGLSGIRVCPELYLACGVSGSAFHTMGILPPCRVVAVNPNRNACIHQLADLSIYEDVNVWIDVVSRAITAFKMDCSHPQTAEHLYEMIKNLPIPFS
ncbi:MAG: FAD-binding protein [Pseudoflavonifractor sp.]|nr:FAD-binding protein [Pseudoflavonifractor sp.]